MGSTQESQGQIFLDGHVGGRSLEGILEHPADDLGAAIVRHHGDVLPRQSDGAGVGDEFPGDGIEQGGFTRPVGAHNGGEIALLQVEVHILQRHLLVDGAGVEGFAHMFQIKHGEHLLSRRGRDGGGRLPAPAGRARQWPAPR